MQKKVCELVLDWSLYPRHQIDSTHVKYMQEAVEAGCTLPPIAVEQKTLRIVDGFHRRRLYERLYGPEHLVEVEAHRYPDDGALFLDAVRRNAEHGHNLTPFDRQRIIARAVELSIAPEMLSPALHVEAHKLELAIRETTKLAVAGKPTALKRTIRHMAGRNLTEDQLEANRKLTGLQPITYANQLLLLLENDLLPEDERIWERLRELHRVLGSALKGRRTRKAS